MSNRLASLRLVAQHEFKRHLSGQRMLLLAPLIIFFLAAACWGFSDPRFTAPAGITIDSPASALFLASTVIVLVCTLAVVLLGFDTISRRRMTGELAIDLSQPMPRTDFALSQLFGVWMAAMLPTLIGIIAGSWLIHRQMGAWPSLVNSGVFVIATGLLLWWYTCLQLLASSYARDMGSSVTLGVGTWLLFTLLWLLVTVVVATFMGVDATDTNSTAFDLMAERMDLFSPNGVFQLLLETMLPESQPQLDPIWIWLSAITWAILPPYFFIRRMNRIKP